MFLSVKNAIKEDLRLLAEEIGEDVPPTAKVADLRKIIIDSSEYKNDPDFVKGILESIVAERIKIKEQEFELEKIKLCKAQEQEFELKKISKSQELELEKLKLNKEQEQETERLELEKLKLSNDKELELARIQAQAQISREPGEKNPEILTLYKNSKLNN